MKEARLLPSPVQPWLAADAYRRTMGFVLLHDAALLELVEPAALWACARATLALCDKLSPEMRGWVRAQWEAAERAGDTPSLVHAMEALGYAERAQWEAVANVAHRYGRESPAGEQAAQFAGVLLSAPARALVPWSLLGPALFARAGLALAA